MAGGLVIPQVTAAAVPESAPTSRPTRVHARSVPPPTTTYAVIGTIAVGSDPNSIAIDPSDDTIYVANEASDDVSVIRGGDGAVVETVAVGHGPCDLAVDDGDDTVYVTNFYGGSLSAINGRSLDDSVTLGVGPYPCGVAVDHADDTVYVLNSDDSDMVVLNSALNTEATSASPALSVREEVAREIDLWDGFCSFDVVMDDCTAHSSAQAAVVGRVVEEAISNAIRHGHASRIEVSVTRDAGNRLVVSITDNGAGPQDASPGMGSAYLSMVSDGRWTMESSGAGTRVLVPIGSNLTS